MFEPRHPGDAKALPSFISRAPTEAAVVAIRDVLVVPTTIVEGDYPGVDEQPAGDPAVELADGLMLERLPAQNSELVMNACTQRGHYYLGVRQFGERYAFVRRVDPAIYEGERSFGWDDGNVIWFAILLSRLIRDNAHSFEFAARIVNHDDGIQQVIPVNPLRYGVTYRLHRDRDWLTASEAGELRQFFADNWAVKDALPWKVIHALNLSEDAVHVHLGILQRALLLISTALEGLIQSHREKVSKQFRERLPQLAAEADVDGVDEEFAAKLYEARSEAAHGAQVSMFQPKPASERPADAEEREQPHGEPEPPAEEEPESPEADEDMAAPVALAQDLLRAATRKAIQDPDFRRIFESDETVAARWPVQI
jgi:hypothetical protein